MSAITFLPTALCTAWTLLGTVSLFDATHPPPRDPRAPLPPVTVLKPLCGSDPSLEANLESFFTQDHPDYELIFGVERDDDPACAVAARLIAQHPDVRARLVVHGATLGQNPKVRNLRAMLPHASHDLVLVSDSNVRAPRQYVRIMAATMAADSKVGLVSSLFVGVGGRGVGSALEAVQLAGFCAAGVALPTALGDAAVVGKSMLFSRAELERLGGLARVADVLAEDYVLGKMFEHGGWRVGLAPVVLDNVLGAMSLRAFAERHLRWSMMRFRLRPFAYLLEPLTSPLAVLPFAWATLGVRALPWAVAMLFVRDVLASLVLRGPAELWRPLLCGWGRELVALVVWAAALFKRHITWRGHRVRVGAGTLLYRER